MNNKIFCNKIMNISITTSLGIASLIFGIPEARAGDTWPAQGEAKIGKAQPHFVGYRVRDIEKWDAKIDPYSEQMKAKVPLQARNIAFPETQANPSLTAPVEVMLMQGDYGNSFMNSTVYNNDFGNLAFNFWQYTDLFSPWHGAATNGTPSSLYNPATSDWRSRGFEFGIVNIPNQAYINAAHKNGVKAIACIYFDPAFRPGQTKREMFTKNENGNFVIADQLIKLADYYGFDGYFLNDEEDGSDEFKEFMSYLTSKGLYTQFYNTNSFFDESKRSYLKDTNGNRIHNSVFINYEWPSAPKKLLQQLAESKKHGYLPYKEAFIGVEAFQSKFNGQHPTFDITKLYLEGSKNPMASIALFTPSDYYQRDLDEDLKKEKEKITIPLHQQEELQWMVASRERMYFSGVNNNPTKTGYKNGASKREIGINDASKWVGVADFKAESSVIQGNEFYSTFNTGKGMAYYSNGQLTNKHPWTNLNDQDILPTWQWWLDSKKDNLYVDFDYGGNEKRVNKAREPLKSPYIQQGAYQGGSSLVVYGDISSENTLRLFKTALEVKKDTAVYITTKNKKTSDVATFLGLIFADHPKELIKLPLKHNSSSDWETQTVPLKEFAKRKIATIAIVFDGNEKNFQSNIGEIKYSDSKEKPVAPANLKLDKLFTTNEAYITWTLESFAKVDKYRIYSVDSKGRRSSLGGIFDDHYYIKNTLNKHDDFSLEVAAVGKNGEESTPSKVDIKLNSMVKNLKVAEGLTKTKLYKQALHPGKVEVSWSLPEKNSTDVFEITVKPINVLEDNEYKTEVSGIETSAVIETGKTDGLDYDVTVSGKKDGKLLQGISYRGKLNDSIAKNLILSDIQGNKDGISLRSPLTQDWRYIRVKSGGLIVKTLERGVTKNYHEKISFKKDGEKLIPLTIELEDYAGNVSEPLVISVNDNNQLIEIKQTKTH